MLPYAKRLVNGMDSLAERTNLSFVVRIWLEKDDLSSLDACGEPTAEPKWAGHIIHVMQEEQLYFRDLQILTDFLNKYIETMVTQ